MLRSAVLAALIVGVTHAAVSVTIMNSCSESIDLYDNSDTTTMAAGASTTLSLANGYVGMFRNGASDEATLAEFSVDSDGTPWYDLSIIPPGSGTCTSLSACQALTGVSGFNTALQIAPQSNTDSANCETVTCLADGCDDAYQFPSDDDNTHTCPSGTSFLVTFCPGGSGGSSSSTTTSGSSSSTESTSSPTVTPTATPEPTTATPVPTTVTPEPTTETPTVTPTVTPTTTTAAPTTAPEPTTEAPTVTPTLSTEAPASSDNSADETGNEAEEGSFTLDESASQAETTAPTTTAPVTTAPATTTPATTASVSTTAAPSTTAPASTTSTPTSTSTSTSTTMSTGTTTTTTTTTDSSDSGSDSAETINTQSSDDSSSTVGIVFAAGAAVLGIAAGGFIYTMRQKRKRLEDEAKTPRDLLAINTPVNVL